MARAPARQLQYLLQMITYCCMVLFILVAMMMGFAESARDQRYCARCHKTLQCPADCPRFNPGNAKFLICKINCATCTAVCKRNACFKKGAVCTDPRFVGGDGTFFYFHGKANEDFCIVSDDALHINGHFIGKRPPGRTRDFTWVQAIGVLYGSHKVSVGAKKVAVWDDAIDQLDISYDGLPISLGTKAGAFWMSPLGDFKVVRTEDVNSVEFEVTNLIKVSVNVTDVNQEDSRIHKYEIDGQDCFAHLDLHFSFFNLSTQVAGVLGQTYSEGYISPVKAGVPMPIMGGYQKFKSSSLFSTDCGVARFDPLAFTEDIAVQSSGSGSLLQVMPSMIRCTSQGENGIVCRR